MSGEFIGYRATTVDLNQLYSLEQLQSFHALYVEQFSLVWRKGSINREQLIEQWIEAEPP